MAKLIKSGAEIGVYHYNLFSLQSRLVAQKGLLGSSFVTED